jgi:hypothetical protein
LEMIGFTSRLQPTMSRIKTLPLLLLRKQRKQLKQLVQLAAPCLGQAWAPCTAFLLCSQTYR